MRQRYCQFDRRVGADHNYGRDTNITLPALRQQRCPGQRAESTLSHPRRRTTRCELDTACDNGGATQEGTRPFASQLSGAVFSPDACPENGSTGAVPNDVDCWDMATVASGAGPTAYWAHIDGYFQLAADRGMQ